MCWSIKLRNINCLLNYICSLLSSWVFNQDLYCATVKENLEEQWQPVYNKTVLKVILQLQFWQYILPVRTEMAILAHRALDFVFHIICQIFSSLFV